MANTQEKGLSTVSHQGQARVRGHQAPPPPSPPAEWLKITGCGEMALLLMSKIYNHFGKLFAGVY